MSKSIAIVGAGVGGSVCARQLSARGFAVKLFDKGRGPGGRTSSRRTDSGHRFDHGAARLDVTRPEMHEALSPAVAAGVLHRSDDTYTSSTGMNALCKWLLEGLPVTYSTKISRIQHEIQHDESWRLFDEAGASHGPFDVVILAVPPVNAAEIVRGIDADLAATISSVQMQPRWVAMLAFSQRLNDVPDRTNVDGHLLRRSMSNVVGDALVVEADQAWSVEHVEQDAAVVGQLLLGAMKPVLGTDVPMSVSAHRWRYAFAGNPLGQNFLNGKHDLYICGDWCLGRSIESAWLSASAVVDAVGGQVSQIGG